jgi:hypothetical protein
MSKPIRAKLREIKKVYFKALSKQEKSFIRSLEHYVRTDGNGLIEEQQKARLNKIYRECRRKFDPRFVSGGLCSPR